jgi:hypothetical protein
MKRQEQHYAVDPQRRFTKAKIDATWHYVLTSDDENTEALITKYKIIYQAKCEFEACRKTAETLDQRDERLFEIEIEKCEKIFKEYRSQLSKLSAKKAILIDGIVVNEDINTAAGEFARLYPEDIARLLETNNKPNLDDLLSRVTDSNRHALAKW